MVFLVAMAGKPICWAAWAVLPLIYTAGPLSSSVLDPQPARTRAAAAESQREAWRVV